MIGIDRDPQALAVAAERLAAAGFADRVVLVHAVYDEIGDVARRARGGRPVQAAFFDLGVSSLQLDERERGFAYAADAPLDMRMDPTTGATAADVLNTYRPRELVRVLREYGEERFASRIAAGIVRERQRQPFSSSAPAGRAALRGASRRPPGAPAATRPSGRSRRCGSRSTTNWARCAGPSRRRSTTSPSVAGWWCSRTTRSRTGSSSRRSRRGPGRPTPIDLPVDLPGHDPEFRNLVRGRSEAPTEQEIAVNPRAASARLRAAERIREAA